MMARFDLAARAIAGALILATAAGGLLAGRERATRVDRQPTGSQNPAQPAPGAAAVNDPARIIAELAERLEQGEPLGALVLEAVDRCPALEPDAARRQIEQRHVAVFACAA